jgi:aminoglycoside 6-adenylyltransferase
VTDRILNRLIEWAGQDATVRAMLLTSSRANPNSYRDQFSDYAVIVAVTDLLPFFENRDWLASFGEVLVVYGDPIRNEGGYDRFIYVTQYGDGAKIDFTLMPVALLKQIGNRPVIPEELDVGYSVLVDKDGLSNHLPPATYKAHIPNPPNEDEFQTLVEDFFHESTYVAKYLWRGDLMPVKFNLDHAMKQLDLRRMMEWRIEVDHNWSVRPGHSGKGLKRLLKPEILRELEATYVGPGEEENWRPFQHNFIVS